MIIQRLVTWKPALGAPVYHTVLAHCPKEAEDNVRSWVGAPPARDSFDPDVDLKHKEHHGHSQRRSR